MLETLAKPRFWNLEKSREKLTRTKEVIYTQSMKERYTLELPSIATALQQISHLGAKY